MESRKTGHESWHALALVVACVFHTGCGGRSEEPPPPPNCPVEPPIRDASYTGGYDYRVELVWDEFCLSFQLTGYLALEDTNCHGVNEGFLAFRESASCDVMIRTTGSLGGFAGFELSDPTVEGRAVIACAMHGSPAPMVMSYWAEDAVLDAGCKETWTADCQEKVDEEFDRLCWDDARCDLRNEDRVQRVIKFWRDGGQTYYSIHECGCISDILPGPCDFEHSIDGKVYRYIPLSEMLAWYEAQHPPDGAEVADIPDAVEIADVPDALESADAPDVVEEKVNQPE